MFLRQYCAAALVATAVAAHPARAQSTTIGTIPDPGGAYVGPFATTASGGTPGYAQAFYSPANGPIQLQTFTLHLGDFNPDGTGAGLQWRASVYKLEAALHAGVFGVREQVDQSEVRTGSANYGGFDAFVLTPDVTLTPSGWVSPRLFAIVLETVGGNANAANVIATGTRSPDDGSSFTDFLAVLPPGGSTISGGQYLGTSSYFSATFGPAPAAVVPEPATVVLLAGGLAGVGIVARRRA